jgi:hypothetical protein
MNSKHRRHSFEFICVYLLILLCLFSAGCSTTSFATWRYEEHDSETPLYAIYTLSYATPDHSLSIEFKQTPEDVLGSIFAHHMTFPNPSLVKISINSIAWEEVVTPSLGLKKLKLSPTLTAQLLQALQENSNPSLTIDGVEYTITCRNFTKASAQWSKHLMPHEALWKGPRL